MEHANYQKQILNTGEIVEIIGTYTVQENQPTNPPEMISDEDLIFVFNIMKKGKVKKLDIII